MSQDNDKAIAARRRFFGLCGPLAIAVMLAAASASGTAYAQRFQGGAGSPDPGMGGTTGSPGIGDTGPLGGGAAAGAGAGAGAATGPGEARPGSAISPGLTGRILSPLPPASVSGATPLGGGSSTLGTGSTAFGGSPPGGPSTGLGGTPATSGLGGTSGTSGFGGGLGGTPLTNPPPTLGGSQPPSNPACGTLTAATNCAAGH